MFGNPQLPAVPPVSLVFGVLQPFFIFSNFCHLFVTRRNIWSCQFFICLVTSNCLWRPCPTVDYRKPSGTWILTPWCRVLLEKLTGLQLVKKFPAFYGTRRFITALTSVRHLSLSCASPIQSTYSHPTSWRPILILSTHLKWHMNNSAN